MSVPYINIPISSSITFYQICCDSDMQALSSVNEGFFTELYKVGNSLTFPEYSGKKYDKYIYKNCLGKYCKSNPIRRSVYVKVLFSCLFHDYSTS